MDHPLTARYTAFLEQVLTPSRLRHSLGVAQVMAELAGIYDLDRLQAVTAGLLHDAAKDLLPHQQEQMRQEGHIAIQHPCELDYNIYLHGPVGAYYVARELGIRDAQVLDAIWMHTWCGSGENFEAPLTWCLRFADILDPGRDWDEKARRFRDGSPALRELVYRGRLKESALFITSMEIGFFEDNQKPIHPNYFRIRSLYANPSQTP
jgi:predicted HD superfamily hydrolase involved in NAD metabolism